MLLEDMTISDVLKTNEFHENMGMIIADLTHTRKKANINSKAPLKRHPIDRLLERGVFKPGEMTLLFANAMNKKLQGYSSNERTFILQVGREALMKTIKQFVDQEDKDDEEARDNGNGTD